MFVVYAHRGASEYAPENTMSAFYMGLSMGANGIETDIQKTKDGVLVLFHDDTLDRVTGRSGKIEDLTYEELCSLRVMHKAGGRSDIIPRLEDFLHYCGSQGVHLALELKSPDIEEEVFAMVKKYKLEKQVVITSFHLEFLIKLKSLYPEAKLGYLTEDFDDDALDKMREVGIYQLCPRGVNLTPEKVSKWHSCGFNVRAWGISDVSVMKHVYDCGADGMTANFPDRLIEYVIYRHGQSD